MRYILSLLIIELVIVFSSQFMAQSSADDRAEFNEYKIGLQRQIDYLQHACLIVLQRSDEEPPEFVKGLIPHFSELAGQMELEDLKISIF